jgi:hypothetical protein
MSSGATNSSEVIQDSPEVRAARFGAVAVVLAGLLGGVVGIAGTVYVNNVQVAAADERSQSEFLRAQRQNAYADLMGDSNHMHDSITEYFQQVIEPVEEVYLATFDQNERRIEDADRELVDSRSVVELIGSSATADAAARLVRAQQELMRDMRAAIAQPDGSDSYESYWRRLNNAALERNRLIQAFVDTARKDLGTD